MTPIAAAEGFPVAAGLRQASTPAVDPSQHSEDRALVEGMLDGDRTAFETFGERYGRVLWRFAAGRLGSEREHAAEIAQTAMTKALSKLESYRGEASLLTWLCACCRNEVLMHFRRRARRPEHVELEEGVERAPDGTARPAEAGLLARERALRVHLVLDSLPAEYARALEWKYVEGLSVRAIARRLERTEKSAESLLTRARVAFRRGWEAFGERERSAGARRGRS